MFIRINRVKFLVLILFVGSKKPTISAIYAIENEKSEKLSKSLLSSAFVFAEILLFPNVFASFVKFITSNYSFDVFELPFPAS